MKKLLVSLFSLFLTLAPAAAQWQTPSHSVPVGRGAGVTGFGSAGPCSVGLPLVGAGAAADPACGPVPNVGIAHGAADTVKGSLDGATTVDVPFSTISAATGSPVIVSRALAQTLDLSARSAISTLGYTTPGDGGEATFRNVGAAPFIDSFVTSVSITNAGTGCTNGSYFGVQWNKTTNKTTPTGTATVAGGVVTAVSVAGTPGNAYAVGDVLTSATIPGCTPSITVTGVSTPLASFTDAVGTHFQYVPGDAGMANVKQFGAVGDWEGTDAGTTDNFNAIQAASWFATYKSKFSFDGGGYWGGAVFFPSGSYMACGTGNKSIIVAEGVAFKGINATGATIKMCDAFAAGVNFIELCDPNWHFACFNSRLEEMELAASRNAPTTSLFAMVHSNATQDFGGLYHVYIYGGLRACAWFEKGFGGASTTILDHVSCSTNSGAPQIIIGNPSDPTLNFGSTIVEMKDLVLGGSSGGSGPFQVAPGISVFGGFVNIDGYHFESMSAGVSVNIQGGVQNGQVKINNINGGSGAPAPTCTAVVQLSGTNSPGNTQISMLQSSPSCTHDIDNGQVGGTPFTGTITKPITCPASGFAGGACG